MLRNFLGIQKDCPKLLRLSGALSIGLLIAEQIGKDQKQIRSRLPSQKLFCRVALIALRRLNTSRIFLATLIGFLMIGIIMSSKGEFLTNFSISFLFSEEPCQAILYLIIFSFKHFVLLVVTHGLWDCMESWRQFLENGEKTVEGFNLKLMNCRIWQVYSVWLLNLSTW